MVSVDHVLNNAITKGFDRKKSSRTWSNGYYPHFSRRYKGCNLKETNVRRFKKEYLVELGNKKGGEQDDVAELPVKKGDVLCFWKKN